MSDPPSQNQPKDQSDDQAAASEGDPLASDAPSDSAVDDSTAPPPRALAQGTGLVLQIIGVLLFLTTCCVCSSYWVWEPIDTAGEMEKQVFEEQKQPIPTLGTLFNDPATAGFSLMMAFSTVGGLAMAVFGLGLQADKPKAALGALASVAAWVFVLLVTGVCLWIGDGSIVARLWNLLLLAIACVLLGFVIASYKQVKRNPPPRGMDVLPADWEPPPRGHH